MNQFIVYNDLHIGTDFSIEFQSFEKDAILLGDVIDLRGCKKNDVDKFLSIYKNLSINHIYCVGNHEAILARIGDYYVSNNIVFAHGHLQFWGYDKSYKYMKKKHGRSTVGRFFSKAINSVRMAKPFSMSQEQKNRCVDLCVSTGTDVIVLGHKHPSEKHDFIYENERKNVRIIVLPRGRNVLYL